MPQFTNPYNSQNGMGPQSMAGYPSAGWMPTGNAPGGSVNQMMSMSGQPNNMFNGQTVTQPMPMQQNNMQDWKPYSPVPVRAIVGRWVNNFDEIKPQDVPMDGSISLFPQSDNTCIYAMMWSNDGKIVPYRFVPEKNEQPTQQQIAMPPEMGNIIQGYEAIATNVADRLAALEGRLDDIYNSISQPVTVTTSTPRTKKTVDKEEK